jgi:hypothetical protein
MKKEQILRGISMANLSVFYIIIDVLLFAYACYSWFWQASIDLKGKYRLSSIVWAIIFIWLGFVWNYIEKGDPGINIFLALFLLVSIIDGFTGFAPKRAVVSGYFKRTIRYSEINMVTLINVPNPKKESVVCLLKTNKNKQYYLRFACGISQIVAILKKHVHHNIKIEIQNLM